MSGTPSVRYPYDAGHPDTLAVYCSDGRFTQAVEDLLRRLEHPRIDTLTIPGGPGLLELTSASIDAANIVRNAATFLITGHGIKSVALIAHQGCGYYQHRFPHDSPEYRITRQTADLRGAGRWVQSNHSGVAVRLFLAKVRSGGVGFEPVEL